MIYYQKWLLEFFEIYFHLGPSHLLVLEREYFEDLLSQLFEFDAEHCGVGFGFGFGRTVVVNLISGKVLLVFVVV